MRSLLAPWVPGALGGDVATSRGSIAYGPEMDPSLVGRASELSRLVRALSAGRGAVVVGEPGVGRTRVVAEAVRMTDRSVVWVPGVAPLTGAPLGALAQLGPEVEAAARHPRFASQGFGAVRKALERRSTTAGRRPVLVVDDAHHLDPLSASILLQLVVLDVATVVATVQARVPLSASIVSLWTEGGCDRIALHPLPCEAVQQLAVQALGGTAGPRVVQRLLTLSAGNPLLLLELVRGGLDQGTLRVEDGVWRLAGDLSTTDRLIDLLRARVHQLPATVRAAAELLSLAEPLDAALATDAIRGDDLGALEAAGLIERREDARGTPHLAFTHPVYGEVLRAIVPEAQRRDYSARLATAAATSAIADVDPLALASWRLDGGLAKPSELVDAATLAISRMAAPLAVRLARAAVASGETEARLVLGRALLVAGELEEAERELRAVVKAGSSSRTRVHAVITRSQVLLGQPGRVDDALGMLTSEAGRPDLAAQERVALLAAMASTHMLLGNLQEASSAANTLLADEACSDEHRLLALTARSLAAAIRLEPLRVREALDEAQDLLVGMPLAPAGSEDLLHANSCAAALLEGDLLAARSFVDQRRQLALEADRPDLLALWSLLGAQVTLLEGDPVRSADLAGEAARLLIDNDPFAIRSLTDTEAAHAAAIAGEVGRAMERLDAVPPNWRQTRRLASRHATVRAWLTLVDRGIGPAVDESVLAGDQAVADGVTGWAIDAWSIAVRLGQATVVLDRLEGLTAGSPVRRLQLALGHASAVAAGDPVALEQAAIAYLDDGYRLLACEAAAQAAAAYRRVQRADRARGAVLLASRCLPKPVRAVTPILSELEVDVGLTAREREIAGFAARGLTSREIAERLGLSRRTVDNRLAGIYAKLGISGRQELAMIFGPGPPPK